MLETWRTDFAKACREQGIMVEASRRFERGLYKKPIKDAVRYIQQRAILQKENKIEVANDTVIHSNPAPKSARQPPKQAAQQTGKTVDEQKAKHRARNQVIRRRYIEGARKAAAAAKQFFNEQKDSLIDIAKTLDEFAKTIPVHEANLEESYQEYLKIKNEQEIEKTETRFEKQIDAEIEIGD